MQKLVNPCEPFRCDWSITGDWRGAVCHQSAGGPARFFAYASPGFWWLFLNALEADLRY